MAGYASEGSHGFISRRGFIKVMSVSAAALLTPGCLREWLSLGHRPKPHAHTPFITPNNDFYLVAVDPSFRPPLEPANVNSKWFLEVFEDNGSSNKLSYNDLFNQATQKIHYTFECIGNTVGGQLIGNAQWHVVPLKKILGPMMKQSKNVKSVMFEGLDDFFSSVSIERAMDDYSFIAMQMNGESLPAAHGFPARVILPDLSIQRGRARSSRLTTRAIGRAR